MTDRIADTIERHDGEEGGAPAAPRFGTFLGVFTPSVLTILGLIMYLRFGWVVGNLGLPLTVLIVLVSSSITFITGLSASAIATNMRIGVGGEYFMIAHSLGLELGGAIGIPLYLCRTLSVTFYSFGLAESLVILWPASAGGPPEQAVPLIAAVIIVVITILSGRSASLALKLQIPIMAAVGISLIALTAGTVAGGIRSPELEPTYRTAPQGIWYVFAVFFPAVTGFTAGIGMSGDLKDPRRSIPRGTLLAVATGAAVYLFVPVLLSMAASIDRETLAAPGMRSWTEIAPLGPVLIYAGMWGAILSSAFGSVLSGPRVLQALSQDGLAPGFLSRLSERGQPTVATWITGALALAAVLLGELNAVAQYVTVLFLTLYVIINVSAAVERIVGDPSYRPTINVPWYVSFLGAAGALVVMFLINPVACVVAMAIEAALFLYLRRRALTRRWGDVRAGMYFSLARFALLKLKKHRLDPRNWRPHIIAFTEEIAKEPELVYIANAFNQNHGIVTVSKIVEGDLAGLDIDVDAEGAHMNRVLKEHDLVGFCEVNVAPDFETGVVNIAQANGIAGLQSNTLMFGWPAAREKLVSQLRILRTVAKIEKNTIIARLRYMDRTRPKKRIDLWWGGLENNGDLMLLLAHLLRSNPEWSSARIKIHSVVRSEGERERTMESMRALTEATRIDTETEIMVRPPETSIEDIVTVNSIGADIILMGLMIPEAGVEERYADWLIELSEVLGSVIFVRNASRFSGRLV